RRRPSSARRCGRGRWVPGGGRPDGHGRGTGCCSRGLLRTAGDEGVEDAALPPAGGAVRDVGEPGGDEAVGEPGDGVEVVDASLQVAVEAGVAVDDDAERD